jgi:hypothetical protein
MLIQHKQENNYWDHWTLIPIDTEGNNTKNTISTKKHIILKRRDHKETLTRNLITEYLFLNSLPLQETYNFLYKIQKLTSKNYKTQR